MEEEDEGPAELLFTTTPTSHERDNQCNYMRVDGEIAPLMDLISSDSIA